MSTRTTQESPRELRAKLASSIAKSDTMARKLRSQGQLDKARDLESTTAKSREALRRLDVELTAKDPRIARMNAVVARATGNDRRICKTVGSVQFAGVTADFDPYAS